MNLPFFKKSFQDKTRVVRALDILSALLVVAGLAWLFVAGFSSIKSIASAQQKPVIEVDKSAYREVEKYLNLINGYQAPDPASQYPNPEPFREYARRTPDPVPAPVAPEAEEVEVTPEGEQAQ